MQAEWRAAVPLLQAIAWLAPTIAAKSASSCITFLPEA
jgi:hypothetical protein